MARFGYTVLGFGGHTPAGGPGTWSNASQTINTNRYQCVTAGNASSAIIAGGSSTGNSEIWDGNTWENADDNLDATSSSGQGGGTKSNAIYIGGSRGTACETWDDSAWSTGSVTTNSTFTVGASAADSSTSAWVCGGWTGSAVGDKCESLSGTTWTTKEDMLTGRLAMGANNSGGASNAAAMTGKTGSGRSVKNEEYTLSGDAWTTNTDITTALDESPACFGQTSADDVIVSHGENATAPQGDTLEWTGGTWTTGNTCLANLRNNYGGGPTGNGITVGGYLESAGAYQDDTYIFTRAVST
jgi:hypothetical protein